MIYIFFYIFILIFLYKFFFPYKNFFFCKYCILCKKKKKNFKKKFFFQLIFATNEQPQYFNVSLIIICKLLHFVFNWYFIGSVFSLVQINQFSSNVSLKDKPGSWFLLGKCLKNTCRRVAF